MLATLLQQVRDRTNPAASLNRMQSLPGPGPVVVTDTAASPVPETQPSLPLRTASLLMVTAENNNKFYEMREQPDGTFIVRYGRVGTSATSATYPMSRWNEKLREKTSKGYVDQTRLFAQIKPVAGAETITDPDVRRLMTRLLDLANQSIHEHYVVTAGQVTRQQVDTAQQLLDTLAALVTPDLDMNTVNQTLLALFQAIPRKMNRVTDHLLTNFDNTPDELTDLHNQLAREQDTLDVMRGQVELATESAGPAQVPPPLLDALGLTMEPITDVRTIALIKSMMGTDASRFDEAFAVRQATTDAAFTAHVSQQPNRKTQLLWHGSRSENWLSILKSGLVLRPANAVISGKMFGYGIYFADEFAKSLNYTSLYGSAWTRGTQREAYLALYEVHVGNQWMIDQHETRHYQLTHETLQQMAPARVGQRYDSVFAKRGLSLHRNEFIVYQQAQCTVRYLIRITA